VEWRAYATSDLTLNALKGDWRVNPTLLNGVQQLSGVEIPALSARGGKGEITIDTLTPVTLVPWCKTEPYVIRTEPRNEGNDSRFAYRIYGASAGTAPTNNYGRDDILIGVNASYIPNSVFLATVSFLNTTGGQNGANATNAQLITSPWSTYGFTTQFWNFDPIVRGYPALRNVGGQ
jgi:hypothetical protein